MVHTSVKGELINCLKAAVNKYFPSEVYAEMPAIINDVHFNRLLGLIDDEKILLGGGRDCKTRFIQPTILDDITFVRWSFMKKFLDLFCQLLRSDSYRRSGISEMSRQGQNLLSLYLFTGDKAAENRILNSISFGGGCIMPPLVKTRISIC